MQFWIPPEITRIYEDGNKYFYTKMVYDIQKMPRLLNPKETDWDFFQETICYLGVNPKHMIIKEYETKLGNSIFWSCEPNKRHKIRYTTVTTFESFLDLLKRNIVINPISCFFGEFYTIDCNHYGMSVRRFIRENRKHR